MSKPHKHADLIKAWADGAEIECRNPDYHPADPWLPAGTNPSWFEDFEYRIKPSKVVRWQWVSIYTSGIPQLSHHFYTKAEALNAFKNGVTVIGKAEWTRMEFDE